MPGRACPVPVLRRDRQRDPVALLVHADRRAGEDRAVGTGGGEPTGVGGVVLRRVEVGDHADGGGAVRGHGQPGVGEGEQTLGQLVLAQGQVHGDRLGPGVGVGDVLADGLARRVRVVGLGERGPGGEQCGLHGGGDVEPAAAGLEGAEPLGARGGADQGVLELLPRPVRVLGGQQGRRARDVRCRHGGAAHRLIGALTLRRVLRAGRQHVHTRGGQVGLDGVVAHAGAAAGEARQLVHALPRAVHRADRQRGVRRSRGAHAVRRGAGIAGRDDEQRSGLLAEPVHRLAERVGAVGGAAAQAHADDLGVLVPGGPLHARQDPGVLTAAVVVQHLADVQPGARGDALLLAAGRGPGAGDGRGDVGPVALPVGDVLPRHETLGGHDAAGEVRVRGVDPGVQHRDVHALPGVPARPDLRGPDLRGGVGQRGLDLPVQPHLRDPARQRRRPRPGRARPGGRRPGTA